LVTTPVEQRRPARADATLVFLVSFVVALVLGTLLAVASRPPPPPCDGTANPLAGLDELIVVGLMVLVALIIGPAGLIVALLARASVGMALVGAAVGLVLAVVIDLNAFRPVGCAVDPRTEPGTITLTIESPFALEAASAGQCFNLRDPDPDYIPRVSSDMFAAEVDGRVVEMFGVQDPLGSEPLVDIWLAVDDAMAMYHGPAQPAGSSTVRFDDLADLDAELSAAPPISGTISWTCGTVD
jgi:hypothetical protein